LSSEKRTDLLGRVIHAARSAEAAVDRFDGLANAALGINRTDGRCLDILDNAGGSITAGRLAELSGLTTAAVTAVVDRLEKKGYVRRVRDEQDRRRVLVEQTPLLRERTHAIWGPLGEEGQGVLGRLSERDLRAVIEYYEISRELNERHAERIRGLRFD
jgi:DNA-binding MarR family transcriptional regulator